MIKINVGRQLGGGGSYSNGVKKTFQHDAMGIIGKQLMINFQGLTQEHQYINLRIMDKPLTRKIMKFFGKDVSNMKVKIKGTVESSVDRGKTVSRKYSDKTTFKHLEETVLGKSDICHVKSFLRPISEAANNVWWGK